MHKRFRTLCLRTGGFLGVGLFYAFLCFLAGKPLIPCVFHLITGLSCPGCGVSRMCLALLRLDFKAAFEANAALLLLMPFGFWIGAGMAVRYVKEGRTQPSRRQMAVLYFMTGVLLVFGVVRNLERIGGMGWR